MIAVILAAGRGSRLGSITNDRPKSLLPLGKNGTLIDYNIKLLKQAGICNIIIVVGYGYRHILKHVSIYDNVKCILNPFWEYCNVLGSFSQAFQYLDDDVLFLHADTLVGKNIWRKLISAESNIVLPYKRKACGSEEMKVKFDKNNNLVEISKTMDNVSADGEFVGIAKFKKESLSYIVEKGSQILMDGNLQAYMEEIIQLAISEKIQIETLEIGDSDFIEVDFENDYLEACKIFG